MIVLIEDRNEANRPLGNLLVTEHGANIHRVSYDSSQSNSEIFDAIYLDVKDHVNFHDIELLIGEGLGGYWALWMASIVRVPTFVVNPDLDPYEDFQAITTDILPNYIPLDILCSDKVDGRSTIIAAAEIFQSREIEVWDETLDIDPDLIHYHIENLRRKNKDI